MVWIFFHILRSSSYLLNYVFKNPEFLGFKNDLLNQVLISLLFRYLYICSFFCVCEYLYEICILTCIYPGISYMCNEILGSYMKIFYFRTSVPVLVIVWACCERGKIDEFFLASSSVAWMYFFGYAFRNIMTELWHSSFTSGANWWQSVKSILSTLNFQKLKVLGFLIFCFLWQEYKITLIHQTCFYFSRAVIICWFSLQKMSHFGTCNHVCSVNAQACLKTCEHHAKLCSFLENSKFWIKLTHASVQKGGPASQSSTENADLVGKGSSGCRVGAQRPQKCQVPVPSPWPLQSAAPGGCSALWIARKRRKQIKKPQCQETLASLEKRWERWNIIRFSENRKCISWLIKIKLSLYQPWDIYLSWISEQNSENMIVEVILKTLDFPFLFVVKVL